QRDRDHRQGHATREQQGFYDRDPLHSKSKRGVEQQRPPRGRPRGPWRQHQRQSGDQQPQRSVRQPPPRQRRARRRRPAHDLRRPRPQRAAGHDQRDHPQEDRRRQHLGQHLRAQLGLIRQRRLEQLLLLGRVAHLPRQLG